MSEVTVNVTVCPTAKTLFPVPEPPEMLADIVGELKSMVKAPVQLPVAELPVESVTSTENCGFEPSPI